MARQSTRSHWSSLNRRWWERLGPPLRPGHEVIDGVRRQLGPNPGQALLLGVTPEYADLGNRLVAVDRSAEMIASVWPGETPARAAVNANWLEMPLAESSIDAVVGDGSFNMLRFPDEYLRVFGELARVVRPRGRVVVRLFERPPKADPVATLREQGLAGAFRDFDVFRWRLAMSLAGRSDDRNVPAVEILRAFNDLFPDRRALEGRSGWTQSDFERIDVYRDSSQSFSFPSWHEFVAVAGMAFNYAERVAVGSYPLAERCPLAVMTDPIKS